MKGLSGRTPPLRNLMPVFHRTGQNSPALPQDPVTAVTYKGDKDTSTAYTVVGGYDVPGILGRAAHSQVGFVERLPERWRGWHVQQRVHSVTRMLADWFYRSKTLHELRDASAGGLIQRVR